MQTPEQKRLAAEARRPVHPRLTLAQAKALIEYLEDRRSLEALGTPLNYTLREVRSAYDSAVRDLLFPQ